jgi:cell division protein FtsZ
MAKPKKKKKLNKAKRVVVKKKKIFAKRKKVLVKKKPKKIVVKRKLAKKKNKPKKLVKKIVIKKKPTKKIVQKKNIAKGLTAEFPAESFFKAKIKVIGIGGGGGSIVSEIGRSLEKATFVIADTDIRALKKKSGIRYFWFGQELTHGLGTGVNVDLAKRAAESARDKISELFKDQDIIIFVASLGGGLGSGATQIFAQAAKEFGGITLGIFTMPFRFEGKNKQRIAQNALKVLKQSLNVSLVIPNEKIFKIIDTSTPITNAFSTVNKSLIESLESLIDLIYNPGVINIDFADLRTILRGRGNSAFLNTIEESGKDRAEKTCEKIFKNPLLQNNGLKAEKILFNIAGSENLSMFEVEKISSHIANLHQKAKIIFGISKEHKLNNKIKTTILMTGGSQAGLKEEKVVEPKTVEKPVASKIETKKEKRELKASVAKVKKSVKNKKQEAKSVPVVPTLETPVSLPVVQQKKVEVSQAHSEASKKTIRRSGLEIKQAEELEEKRRQAQEKEWEIPAFLRKVKFNK